MFKQVLIEGFCWRFPTKTIYYNKRVWKPHRLAYFLVWGVVPHTVSHTCGQAWCCNPNHLTPFARKYPIGKAAPQAGEKHHLTHLTDDDILMIRRLVGWGITHQRLAEAYHVCRSAITHIVGRRNWRHVEDPQDGVK